MTIYVHVCTYMCVFVFPNYIKIFKNIFVYIFQKIKNIAVANNLSQKCKVFTMQKILVNVNYACKIVQNVYIIKQIK